jgi:hypothetical protein
MRDRLIKIIANIKGKADDTKTLEEVIANELLAEGVIVPPCKVGDKVYKVYDIESVHRRVLELEVLLIEIGDRTRICLKTTKNHLYNFDKTSFEDFGKTVFLTKEEAEKALERSDNG